MAHYGDQRMPMQLRMVGEEVYRSPPAGSSSVEGVRKVMVSIEAGGPQDGRYHSTATIDSQHMISRPL
jgi:splicing suppressor protein 51